jgi:outer membrane protein
MLRSVSACRVLFVVASLVAAAGAQQDPPPQDPKPQSPARPEKPQQGRGDEPIPVDVEADRQRAPVRTLTLGDALRVGRGGNVVLRAASLVPEQARMELLFAEAGFVPELYGAGGFGERKAPQRNAFSPSITSQTIDAQLGWRQRVVTGGLFDLAFQPTRFDSSESGGTFPETQFTSEWAASYRQPLLRGAWSDYATAPIAAARYQVTQAQHQFERAVQDTLLRIVEAYWELVFVRENWRVVQQALGVAEEQLRITDERIRVQALAPRDRVADEAEVALRREQSIVAEKLILTREDELRQLLLDGGDREMWRTNLRPTSPIEVMPTVDALDVTALVENALANRPDVRALRNGLAVAEVAQLQAERDTLPGLDLVGSYSSEGVRDEFDTSWRDAADQQYPGWSVRLEFAIPLGNQAARSRATRATLEVERQNRLLHAAILDVTREVREAVRSLQTLAQSIAASGESVRLAAVNLETEQVKLRVGSSTAFEVQRRNQDLLEAKSRLLRNQLDFRSAQSRLLHVQGVLRPDAP